MLSQSISANVLILIPNCLPLWKCRREHWVLVACPCRLCQPPSSVPLVSRRVLYQLFLLFHQQASECSQLFAVQPYVLEQAHLESIPRFCCYLFHRWLEHSQSQEIHIRILLGITLLLSLGKIEGVKRIVNGL